MVHMILYSHLFQKRMTKVDKDDDANEPELSPAFRSRSSGKSESDFRATVECETGSQDRQRGLAGKTKHRVCQEAEAGRERHERSCRTGISC